MSFVTVFMTVTTAFVLLAPIAMATVLVTGTVPFRRSPAIALVDAGCACGQLACSCTPERELRPAA